MRDAFLEHLRANNSGGLEAVWGRTPPLQREALVEAILTEPAGSEAHLFLRALLDAGPAASGRLELMQTGIDALSDLASTGSADRPQRLSRWASAGPVREALLATAAQRAAAMSNDLLEWLASTDDDALIDALIPVLLDAVERRDGARLQRLADLATRTPRLSSVQPRFDALKRQSREEWVAFAGSLGLAEATPFAAVCRFRASKPLISLSIDPRRLNWFELEWGPLRCDSTRRPVEGFPVDPTGPLHGLPGRVRAAMKTLRLRARRQVFSAAPPSVVARLGVWLDGR